MHNLGSSCVTSLFLLLFIEMEVSGEMKTKAEKNCVQKA